LATDHARGFVKTGLSASGREADHHLERKEQDDEREADVGNYTPATQDARSRAAQVLAVLKTAS
jgi:hypothetical protein